jgi:hypothetical protein
MLPTGDEVEARYRPTRLLRGLENQAELDAERERTTRDTPCTGEGGGLALVVVADPPVTVAKGLMVDLAGT